MVIASWLGRQERGNINGDGLVGVALVITEASMVVPLAEVMSDTKTNCLSILVWLSDRKMEGESLLATKASINARSCN